jgi:homoserine O-acetyltransferase
MGGMIALEFALIDPRIKRAFLMAMGKAHTAWSIGLSHLQRQAIYQDPHWMSGWYTAEAPPSQGLSLARQIGMMTYRSPENYEAKFGRDIREITNHPYYQVESYLDYQGQKLNKRFDALSYERLTRSMDTHDISRDRGSFKDVAKELIIPIHVVGIQSDALYPVSEQKELAQLLPNGQFTALDSPYGHDAFLIEFDQLTQILSRFLATT